MREKAKRKLREERLRNLKIKIEKILHEYDPLTAKEKSWRDKKLKPLSRFLRSWDIRANHVSYVGIILVAVYTILMWQQFYMLALFTGVTIMISDCIDGPLARLKYPRTNIDDVTGWGTILDHARDFSFALAFGYDAFLRFGNATAFEICLAICVFFSYFLILAATLLQYRFLQDTPFTVFLRDPSWAHFQKTYCNFCDFALKNLQTSFWGRVQFVLLAAGIMALFVANYWKMEALSPLAYTILGGELVIGFRNLLEEHFLR